MTKTRSEELIDYLAREEESLKSQIDYRLKSAPALMEEEDYYTLSMAGAQIEKFSLQLQRIQHMREYIESQGSDLFAAVLLLFETSIGMENSIAHILLRDRPIFEPDEQMG